jgi:hypothetical protein
MLYVKILKKCSTDFFVVEIRLESILPVLIGQGTDVAAFDGFRNLVS